MERSERVDAGMKLHVKIMYGVVGRERICVLLQISKTSTSRNRTIGAPSGEERNHE